MWHGYPESQETFHRLTRRRANLLIGALNTLIERSNEEGSDPPPSKVRR